MQKAQTLKQLDRITGRVEWIQNELPEKHRRAKELLEKAKSALIDAIREIENL